MRALRPRAPRLSHGPVGGALSGPPLRARGPASPAPARWALDGRLASASATPAASRPQPRRHHAQPPPLPQPDAPRRAKPRRTARRLLSLRHRGTLTSEAPPAATAAGTAAVASAAAAPSAAVHTGASPRGHSPPAAAAAAAAALPSPVSGLGSGTTPGSPRRHFDSDREQEGLASARPWRACAALRSRTAPPAPAVGAPPSRDPTSAPLVGGGGARQGGAFPGAQAKRRVRAHSSD